MILAAGPYGILYKDMVRIRNWRGRPSAPPSSPGGQDPKPVCFSSSGRWVKRRREENEKEFKAFEKFKTTKG